MSTPIDRAAEAAQEYPLGVSDACSCDLDQYGPQHLDDDAADGISRAVFASIDVEALARAMAREDGWIGELAQAHTYHGGLYLRRARAVLAYLTGGAE